MRSPVTRRYTLGLAVLILAASSANAKEFRPVLDVRTATGQKTFHIGERISLNLRFTNPNDTQYGIAPWNNGRGGEFDWLAEPAECKTPKANGRPQLSYGKGCRSRRRSDRR
jgi:hypothetical protein